ncbi:MAG: NADase-type glycan-binding domain-containing protein [Chitinophagaceae bacterium]
MRHLLLIISLIFGLLAYGQNEKVNRLIFDRDISDSTKRLFYAQLDSFQKYQAGIIPLDTRNGYLLDSSLITYRKNESEMVYGIKMNFGRIGGIGCGYHEGDEPHKITITKRGKELNIPLIYDFEDSIKWLSSSNFKEDKINLYFNEGFPPLTTLIFFAGDQSSIENWNRYSRPKTIVVYINSKHWTDLVLKDCICKQVFNFEPIQSKNKKLIMSFVIKDTYLGQDKRVAISEINFDGLIH